MHAGQAKLASKSAELAQQGKRLGGRQKGTPNKVTAALKDAILMAADAAHPEGMVVYLTHQAQENPTAFMSLLGRVVPADVNANIVHHMVARMPVEPKSVEEWEKRHIPHVVEH